MKRTFCLITHKGRTNDMGLPSCRRRKSLLELAAARKAIISCLFFFSPVSFLFSLCGSVFYSPLYLSSLSPFLLLFYSSFLPLFFFLSNLGSNQLFRSHGCVSARREAPLLQARTRGGSSPISHEQKEQYIYYNGRHYWISTHQNWHMCRYA